MPWKNLPGLTCMVFQGLPYTDIASLLSHNPITEPTTTTKSPQSCPTLCDPIDGSPRGSPIPGIFQARVLEWGARTYSPAKLNLSLTTLSNVFHPTYALHYPVSFIILYTVGNYLIYLRSVPCLSEWKSHEKKDFSLFSAEYPGTRTVFVTQYVLYKYL